MKYNKEFFHIRILYPVFYILMPLTLNTNYTPHDRQESRMERNQKKYIQAQNQVFAVLCATQDNGTI